MNAASDDLHAWTPEDGATAGAVACVLLEAAACVPVLHWAPERLGFGLLFLPFLGLLFSGPGAYALGLPLARLLRRMDRPSAVMIALSVGPAIGLLNRSVLLFALCNIGGASFSDPASAAIFAAPGALGGLGIGVGTALMGRPV